MEMIGSVLRIEKKKAYIFTTDAQIVAIQARKGQYVGEQISFKEAEIIPPKKYSTDLILKSVVAIAAAIALVLIGIYAGLHIVPGNSSGLDTKCALVMSVDINPGIQLMVNQDAIIIEAIAMNDDGAAVLEGLELKNETVKQGVRDILDHAEELGYINSETNLIMVTGVVSDETMDNIDDYTEQMRNMFATLEQEYGSNLFTVLSTDSKIIDQAAADNLSVGKEMFYYYSTQVGAGMTVEDISSSSITDIVAKLNAGTASGSIDSDIKTALAGSQTEVLTADSQATATPEPTLEPMVTNTPSPTPDPATATPTSEPTQEPASATPTSVPATSTPTPTPAVTNSISPKLTVGVSGEELTFSWTGFSDSSVVYNGKTYSGFNYYKVVASKTNPSPVYPDDGYLTYFSSKSETSWSMNPATDSYGSPYLEAGETYYFSITYVFDNGKFSSNTVQKTVPESTSSTVGTITPTLQASSGNTYLDFSWTPINGNSIVYGGKTYKGFNFYKVVASATDSTPVYPENGYLYYTSNAWSDGWSFNPFDENYNKSPELKEGKTYYFAISYVFDNGTFTSNTITLTVPEDLSDDSEDSYEDDSEDSYEDDSEDSYEDDSEDSYEIEDDEYDSGSSYEYYETDTAKSIDPVLEVKISDGKITFEWETIDGNSCSYQGTTYKNFYYYKVVVDEFDSTPIYPDNGYLYYSSDTETDSWTSSLSREGLTSGHSYYMTITYVFENGKFTSNVLHVTIP